jgi:predicted metal-dependent hydrolase
MRTRHPAPDALRLPGFEHLTVPTAPPSRVAAAPDAAPVDIGPPGGSKPDEPNDPVRPAFRVEVVRSAKRKRTVGAELRGDVLRLAIPRWMSATEEQHWVDEMTRRFVRKTSTDRFDLTARAHTLAARHGLRTPAAITWSDDMTTRWGSCTPSTRAIRLSTRLAAFPDWVVDYVIVHELAHLDVPGHGDDFWQLVNRFPRTERAMGYLIAKSGDAD